jgi:hypothetical protein
MMVAHPNKFVHVTLAGYLIFVRNDGIPTIVISIIKFVQNMLKP